MADHSRAAHRIAPLLFLLVTSLLACTSPQNLPTPSSLVSPRLVATAGPSASPTSLPSTPGTLLAIPATLSRVATPCATPDPGTASGRFTPLNLPPVPEQDAYLVAPLTSGEVVMFSANRHKTHFGGIAFIYNPTNDHYEEIPLPPREGMFDWFIPLRDGRAVAGAVGTYAGRDFLSVSFYESATRRFGPIIDLKPPGLREFAHPSSAVMLANGDILLLDSRQAWRYHLDQQQVVLTAPKRTGAYLEVVALSDGRALVLSGNGPGRAPDVPFVTVEGEIYDPQMDGWRTITPIPPGPRSGFEATVLADGRVMVAGGSTLNFDQLARVDIYDPRTDTWQPAAPLPLTLSGFRITPLRDGTILMTGGEPVTSRAPRPYPPIYENSAYAYNPRDNYWIRVGQMTAPHAYHQAQRLPDGRVLLIVGTAGELFTPPCWPQICSSCP